VIGLIKVGTEDNNLQLGEAGDCSHVVGREGVLQKSVLQHPLSGLIDNQTLVRGEGRVAAGMGHFE
jgi:hypothetical protein